MPLSLLENRSKHHNTEDHIHIRNTIDRRMATGGQFPRIPSVPNTQSRPDTQLENVQVSIVQYVQDIQPTIGPSFLAE